MKPKHWSEFHPEYLDMFRLFAFAGGGRMAPMPYTKAMTIRRNCYKLKAMLADDPAYETDKDLQAFHTLLGSLTIALRPVDEKSGLYTLLWELDPMLATVRAEQPSYYERPDAMTHMWDRSMYPTLLEAFPGLSAAREDALAFLRLSLGVAAENVLQRWLRRGWLAEDGDTLTLTTVADIAEGERKAAEDDPFAGLAAVFGHAAKPPLRIADE